MTQAKRFRVSGYCFVPAKAECIVVANNATDAMEIANVLLRDKNACALRSAMVAGSVDEDSPVAFKASTAEEIDQ